MNELTAGQLAAISRLFSSSVIQEMARKGKSPLFARLANQSHLVGSLPADGLVRCLFEEAYSKLRREGWRHEYIYKTALIHKILLGRHSLQTASMLTEFRVCDCKADLVILNGTSTAYEVKSERDSLCRLQRQVVAYSRVFARVNVIASENHLEAIEKSVPKSVGISCLTRRHQISTAREAVDRRDYTSPEAIFNSLRTEEARRILLDHAVPIPNVPNTRLNSELGRFFLKLSPRDAHDGMVRVLKQTRKLLPLSDLIEQLPSSLQAAALSIPLRKADHIRLIAAANTRLSDAVMWS